MKILLIFLLSAALVAANFEDAESDIDMGAMKEMLLENGGEGLVNEARHTIINFMIQQIKKTAPP